MEIRSYWVEDAAKLCLIHNQISGDRPITAADFHADLSAYEHAWVGVVEGVVVGYTAVTAVPGLPHVRVLQGFIDPAWQRQGWGSRLLQHLMADLRAFPNLRLSHCTDDTESAAYHFLRHHEFFIEHEEQFLVLPLPPYPLAPALPHGCRLRTLPRSQAITQFMHLYDQSFGPHPWYQPYSAAEVAALLYRPQDLLFLYCGDEPIGFAWAKMVEQGVGEIEPVGVLSSWQGRGYGRFLLQSAIHNLASRSADNIHIGTWAENAAALHLYRSLGFQPDYTLTYLAYDL
jgi:mycothiol synthase